MIKYMLSFAKTGTKVYIGHLDLLRMMHKCARLARLPVCFSKGFNPHLLVTAALPLALGMAGENECAVIEMENEIEPGELIARLNNAAPEGLSFTKARIMDADEKSPAALVCCAGYEIRFPDGCRDLRGCAEEIKNAASVIANHPKTGAPVEIRDDIKQIDAVTDTVIYCVLSAGSAKSLKPQTLAAYMAQRAEIDVSPYEITYTRSQIYKKSGDGGIMPLFERCAV